MFYYNHNLLKRLCRMLVHGPRHQLIKGRAIRSWHCLEKRHGGRSGRGGGGGHGPALNMEGLSAWLWGGCIKGKRTSPGGSSFLCRFQHSQSHRSPAGKTTRPTSRFRIPRETTTSPSSRTRSTIALPPVSTPCTWDSSPPATMSTSTQLPVPTVN